MIRTILAIVLPGNDFKGWLRRDLSSADTYFSGIDQESNAYLWQKINLERIESVLELGSNSGTRIFRQAQRNPEIHFLGIDINKDAVQKGNLEAAAHNIVNLEFATFDIRTRTFSDFISDKQYDLVISWACLMYIHPFYISRILGSLLSSSKRLILLELDTSYPCSQLVFGGTNWRHNYSLILKNLSSKYHLQINVSKEVIPKDIWNPGGGGGALLIIEKVQL